MKTRLQMMISTVLIGRVDKYCKRQGVSRSQLFTMAVSEYLNKWGY